MPAETLRMPVQELTTGSTFAGRYQIIEELGHGGMGKVYKVFDTKIQEKIALKLIKPEVASDEETIERFSNELKLARKVRHENVCGMFDLGEWEGSHFITMEYVSGEDLKSFIRRSRHLTVETAVGIATQICLGLAAAHKLGVIHRDLKPGNIMVDREGNARIMDFGIARSLKAKGITGAGMMIGTPEYMSPEQAEGKEVDQRSDIYSLGVILFEMLTGRVPFEGETPLGVALKHKTEPAPDPKKLNPQIPDALSQLVRRCMEKDRARRYQSAESMRTELEKIEKGLPTAERAPTGKKPFASREIAVKFKPSGLRLAVLALLVLSAAAFIFWRIVLNKPEAPPSGMPTLAVLDFTNNTGDRNLDSYGSAVALWLISDLNQSRYIKVLSDDVLYGILRKLNLLQAARYAAEDLEKIAVEGEASHILRGAFSKKGDVYRIDYSFQDMRSREAKTGSVEAESEAGFPSLVDQITDEVKKSLELTAAQLASDLDEGVGKITTDSLEAFRFYTEARKYSQEGLPARAIELGEKAVALDPDFAGAYLLIGSSYSHLGKNTKYREYMAKAMEHLGHLSERERLRIQAAFYATSERTYDKAIEIFTKLLELYPHDVLRVNLGNRLSDLERWEESLDQYDWSIKKKIKEFQPYGAKASVLSALGRYEEAIKTLEGYLQKNPDHRTIRSALASKLVIFSRFDRALAEFKKLYPDLKDPSAAAALMLANRLDEAEALCQESRDAPNPRDRYRWGIVSVSLHQLQGRFREAKSRLLKALESARAAGEEAWIARSLFQAAHMDMVTGNLEDALHEIGEALDVAVKGELISHQIRILNLKGLILLRLGRLNEAEDIANALKATIDGWLNDKLMRYYFHLLGAIEREKGNLRDAIGYFEKAEDLEHFEWGPGFPPSDFQALFFDSLASAYYQSDDVKKARREYEKITRLTTGRYHYGDIYAKSFYMLGKIFEKLKNNPKARENYQLFLELWKNADPDRPEPADARKRLAALT
ncbi:MAG: hypothetical protein A2W03_03055 [Candidatus Aminicenantes bacterium RBG_16_63_16]|nr:MAG: hypothetical protein A2W03_03055 [Candidatus Aminicenantes bacterium RBG_16_63_16]